MHSDHHSHVHHHGGCNHHHHHGGSARNILMAFALNLAFALIELVGGILTGSVSILSDALHDLGDSASLGLAWYLERISGRGRDNRFSYGYKRFSLLSVLLLSIILIVGSVFVIEASIERLLSPRMPNAQGMLWLAVLGVHINGFAAWRMSRGHSLSDRAIRLHLMEDVLGWLAVLIVSVVMLFIEIPILDPLLSLGITAWILYNVYLNMRNTLHILLQGVPQGVDLDAFRRDVVELAMVRDVHDLHAWTLNGEDNIASLHVIVSAHDCMHAEPLTKLKEEIRKIGELHHIQHLTIELDIEGQNCCLEHC